MDQLLSESRHNMRQEEGVPRDACPSALIRRPWVQPVVERIPLNEASNGSGPFVSDLFTFSS